MDSEQRRAIAQSVTILVTAVVIIGVIVWAIFFRGSDSKKNTSNTSPPTAQQSDKKRADSSDQKADQKPGETKAAGRSGQTNATSQNQQPQQLANVGPGNLLPLFVTATAGGTILHAFARRHRLSKMCTSD